MSYGVVDTAICTMRKRRKEEEQRRQGCIVRVYEKGSRVLEGDFHLGRKG